jgi:RNA polymerase sigma-70 factor, ECF subfamily
VSDPLGQSGPDVPVGGLLEDHRTLARMAAGDASALADLYDRHGRAVYSLACHILGDRTEAEDITQDVFSQAWRQAAQYDARRATAAGWLLMMSRTRSIDRLRARRTRPQTMAGDLPESADLAAGPEAGVIGAETAARLREALGGLPDPQRAAIELAYYGGLSHTDIAARLSLPLGTIKTRIRTGLLSLRSAMADE